MSQSIKYSDCREVAANQESDKYWEQHDSSMYSDANIATRESLRHHTDVLEALERWHSTRRLGQQ